ncbi:hypothetical protein CON36_36750 [Bacillus cereus]|uniref:Uncharacterized protein n=1 Tax=Bacillus cereus TaxID=1396 RepID=A0A9X6SRN9_BACCE|nr:hypothetical protein [Bacillus cereus]PDZ93899.1 hypothetical protein CON36_36750 [Bacillus cereus]
MIKTINKCLSKKAEVRIESIKGIYSLGETIHGQLHITCKEDEDIYLKEAKLFLGAFTWKVANFPVKLMEHSVTIPVNKVLNANEKTVIHFSIKIPNEYLVNIDITGTPSPSGNIKLNGRFSLLYAKLFIKGGLNIKNEHDIPVTIKEQI